MKRIEIPTGARFGRLVVTGPADASSLEAKFACRCDCGSEIEVRSSSLRNGKTRSCGCLRIESDRLRSAHAVDSFAARFSERIAKAGPNDCWLWTGMIDSKGYGVVRVPGVRRQAVASRVSYELHVGQISEGRIVCHRCDNPSCVNPLHLFLGTHQDNSDDKIQKGRDRKARGAQVGNAKLTDAQVADIRSSPLSLREVGKRFGITYGHAGKIRRGELWAQ